MRKIAMLMAALLAGCATTTTRLPDDYETLVKEMSEMRREFGELKKENAGLKKKLEENTTAAVPVAEPAEEPIDLEDMSPPPAQPSRGPPQNWAWLGQPPKGCETGVYSMEIVNKTEHFVELSMDGSGLKVRGAKGLLPFIPPHEKVYVCLNNTGTHTFLGMLYASRYGRLDKVGKYRYEGTWTAGSALYGRQRLEIRPYYITWH